MVPQYLMGIACMAKSGNLCVCVGVEGLLDCLCGVGAYDYCTQYPNEASISMSFRH